MEKLAFTADGINKDQIIEFKKLDSVMRKNARKNARHSYCMLCNKKVDGFCKSHCVPQMCLKNIETNGKVGSIYSIIDNEIINNDHGVSNAGVFHNICHNCDNTVFQIYENPQSYNGDIANNAELLNQIVLKNTLRDIYKHEIELEYFKQLPSETYKRNGDLFDQSFAKTISKSVLKARVADIEECKYELEKCKKYLSSKEPWLKVITCEKLDYKVPIIYQGMIALTTGFEGEIINNKFSFEKGYQMEYIHMAILPFEKKSVILLLIDQNNKRYDRFIHKMQSLSKTKQIQVINHILFLCCEDYFISKNLSKRTLNKVKETASLIEDLICTDKKESLKNAIAACDLKKAWSQTNILGIHA